MKKQFKFPFLPGFILKIAAIFTMTIDHIGVVMGIFFSEYDIVTNLYPIFRIIGRFALPLFCFMIVEGVLHTRSFKKYILSLGIIGGSVLIGHIFLVHVMNESMGQGNIFLDLILGAVAIKCLNDKRPYIKPIALLPIAYCVFSHFMNLNNVYPEYLLTQYGFYGMALILGFYAAYLLTRLYYNVAFNSAGLKADDFKDTAQYRIVNNLLAILILVIITFGYHFINYFNIIPFTLDTALQNYAVLSGALLLLYNGKRGYNSNWFKYGCYIYYPAHLLIIYGIAYLIFMI